MIKPHCFEKAWIDAFKAQEKYRRLNPPILEKMINALYLLQLLQKNDFNFIFKGGTSLILILEAARRFSVDIDIITRHSQEEIEVCLQKIVEMSRFTAWRLDAHRSYQKGVPKAHYELDYPSNINRASSYIQLDILFEDPHYPKVQEKEIFSLWIETEEIISVKVPTVESIVGDKLTAFAPETTGIPFGKDKEAEIIKQLFDIGHLYDEATNMEEVFDSFHAFVRQEIGYRELAMEPDAVLWDIIKTSRLLAIGARLRTSDQPAKGKYDLLLKGIKAFDGFLAEGHFRPDDAILAGAKASYLAARILEQRKTDLEKYEGQDVSPLNIANIHWNALNRIKRLPEAYFYWYKTLEILDLIDQPPAETSQQPEPTAGERE
jgi:predicted nucleotidyltransferase component of viral defense system